MVAWPQRGKPSGMRFASQPPVVPPVVMAAHPHAHAAPVWRGADDDDDADLAPTQPSIPSLPRIERITPAIAPDATATINPRMLAVVADFAAFVLARNYMHGPRLDGLTIDQRMRLFSHVAHVYLPVLVCAGRMRGPLEKDESA